MWPDPVSGAVSVFTNTTAIGATAAVGYTGVLSNERLESGGRSGDRVP